MKKRQKETQEVEYGQKKVKDRGIEETKKKMN